MRKTIVLSLMLCLTLVVSAMGTTSYELTWYFDGLPNYNTFYAVYTYQFGLLHWLNEAYDYNNQTVISTNKYFQFGIRVYVVNENGTETRIDGGSSTQAQAVVQRNNGEIAEGYQSATWTPTARNLTWGDSLVVKCVQRYSVTYPTIWSVWAQDQGEVNSLVPTFLTPAIGGVVRLSASTWNVTQYTYRGNIGKSFGIHWGDSSHASRIEGITFDNREPPVEPTVFLSSSMLLGVGFVGIIGLPFIVRFRRLQKKVERDAES